MNARRLLAALTVVALACGSSVAAAAKTPPKHKPAAKKPAASKKLPHGKPILTPKKVQLVGIVDNGTITLQFNRKQAKRVPAGSYWVMIYDKSKKQNFDLRGPKGFAPHFTPPKFTGQMFWKVKLIPGAYVYFSDAKSTVIKGSFTVSK